MTEKRFLELAKECGVNDIEIGTIDKKSISFMYKIEDWEKMYCGFTETTMFLDDNDVPKEIAMLYVVYLKEIENE